MAQVARLGTCGLGNVWDWERVSSLGTSTAFGIDGSDMLDDLISICLRLRGSKEAGFLSFIDRCGLGTLRK